MQYFDVMNLSTGEFEKVPAVNEIDALVAMNDRDAPETTSKHYQLYRGKHSYSMGNYATLIINRSVK